MESWVLMLKSQFFSFIVIFIYMGNHKAAKDKIKDVTARLEKALYVLKYGHEEFTDLTVDTYKLISDICKRENIPFPLIIYKDKYYLDGENPKIFCILSKLADDHQIVLNYKKLTRKFA